MVRVVYYTSTHLEVLLDLAGQVWRGTSPHSVGNMTHCGVTVLGSRAVFPPLGRAREGTSGFQILRLSAFALCPKVIHPKTSIHYTFYFESLIHL